MPRNLLSSAGLRCTHRRETVLQVFSQCQKPLTADEVHAEALKTEAMGLSTTYRMLSQLTERGLLLKNEGGDGRSYYQLATTSEHMHTLHCTACGNVLPIEGCPLGALEAQLTEATGFLITGHSLTFTGICPDCRKNGVQAHGHCCHDCKAHETK